MVEPIVKALIDALERQDKEMDSIKKSYQWFKFNTLDLLEQLGLVPTTEYERKGFLRCVFQDDMVKMVNGKMDFVPIPDAPVDKYVVGKRYWVSKDECEKRRWWMRISY